MISDTIKKIVFVASNILAIAIIVIYNPYSLIAVITLFVNGIIVMGCIWDEYEGLKLPIFIGFTELVLLIVIGLVLLDPSDIDIELAFSLIYIGITSTLLQVGYYFLGAYQLFVYQSKPIHISILIIYTLFIVNLMFFLVTHHFMFIIALVIIFFVGVFFRPRKNINQDFEEEGFEGYK